MDAQYMWVGIRTQSPATVRAAVHLAETGETQATPTAVICGAHLANGWYIIVWNTTILDDPEDTASGQSIARQGSEGREAVLVTRAADRACAQAFGEGQPLWSVTRDRSIDDLHLQADGALPIEYSGIRAWHLHDQKNEQGTTDHLIDVPLELARRLVGYHHDPQHAPDVTWSVLQAVEAAPDPVSSDQAGPARSAPARAGPPQADVTPVVEDGVTEDVANAATHAQSNAPALTPRRTLRERVHDRIRVLRKARSAHPSDQAPVESSLEDTERQGLLAKSRARRQARRAAKRDRRAAKNAQQSNAAPEPTPRQSLRAGMRERVRRKAREAGQHKIQLPTDTSDLTFADPGIAVRRRKRVLAKSRARRRGRQAAKRRGQEQGDAGARETESNEP